MKSAQYYLDRAAEMDQLAQNASGEEHRRGFAKAAEAYRALAVTAAKFRVLDPRRDDE